MVIDTFVQELKTYVQMRLSNRISINCSFILDFQGRLEDKLKASLDKLAKGSNSLAQSLALQQTRGNCSTDIDSWDLSTLINIFKEYYLDCFGKVFFRLTNHFGVEIDFKPQIPKGVHVSQAVTSIQPLALLQNIILRDHMTYRTRKHLVTDCLVQIREIRNQRAHDRSFSGDTVQELVTLCTCFFQLANMPD